MIGRCPNVRLACILQRLSLFHLFSRQPAALLLAPAATTAAKMGFDKMKGKTCIGLNAAEFYSVDEISPDIVESAVSIICCGLDFSFLTEYLFPSGDVELK